MLWMLNEVFLLWLDQVQTLVSLCMLNSCSPYSSWKLVLFAVVVFPPVSWSSILDSRRLLCRFLGCSFIFLLLWFSTLQILTLSASTGSDLNLFSSARRLCSVQARCLCCGPEHGFWLKTTELIWCTLLVFHLLGITTLHWLLPNIETCLFPAFCINC